jgi:hypothetical protein
VDGSLSVIGSETISKHNWFGNGFGPYERPCFYQSIGFGPGINQFKRLGQAEFAGSLLWPGV